MEYTKNAPLKVFTAFSGYDSQCLALQRLKQQFPNFDFRLVGWSEIEGGQYKRTTHYFPKMLTRTSGI